MAAQVYKTRQRTKRKASEQSICIRGLGGTDPGLTDDVEDLLDTIDSALDRNAE